MPLPNVLIVRQKGDTAAALLTAGIEQVLSTSDARFGVQVLAAQSGRIDEITPLLEAQLRDVPGPFSLVLNPTTFNVWGVLRAKYAGARIVGYGLPMSGTCYDAHIDSTVYGHPLQMNATRKFVAAIGELL